MAQGLRILYNTQVKQILYAKKEVMVQTPMHAFKGDAVLVTVPLGVLKADDIQFEPPLPLRKKLAIQRIGFGLLNKIVLLFPRSFWGDRDMFGRLPELSQTRGEGYLFYSYSQISGAPVLAGLMSGNAAKEFEERSPEESTSRVMAMLRGIYEPKGITVPPPLQVCCTRWGKDKMARGSYSSMAVGALGGEDYDILGENIVGRVFFAGESTTRKYPATMHGAYYSGAREAANIISTLDKASADIRLADRDQAKSEQDEVLASTPIIETEAYKQTAELWLCLRDLENTFRDPQLPPDKEFGCFAAILGPPESDHRGKALLRVNVGAAKGKALSAKNAPAVLVSIPLPDLQRLQDVSGGDESRMSFLASLQSVKLVGRAGLAEEELDFLRALLTYRKAGQHGRPYPVNSVSLPATAPTQAAVEPIPIEPRKKARPAENAQSRPGLQSNPPPQPQTQVSPIITRPPHLTCYSLPPEY